ncbi:hypothetical protein GCM10010495_69680 [Kitasatospora herbaricolor]|uniref:hypothetical protein n=1 Tax=Kitasatospora herbaricolor TaxID=68217 RepID=UPI00174D4DF5|nr:hypothetical protein [Kitasatospora herbaricolor]MDQ0313317.1 hypothetical protein [Kitasatospora herbaricolor]GGV42087.1 hypothetical protein GCM10010495_69680 [Kitasatospora herbaricolor]
MRSLKLLHLTFAGYGKPTAQIVFDPRLTVIYGASDTGKSFIAESIDYVLGATRLDLIPEAEGYTQILLGLELPDGRAITLMRPPGSNRVKVYFEDLRQVVHQSPGLELAARHSMVSTRNISRYLLEQLGLDDTVISTNDTGGTRGLSFRDLVHLCLVTETRMVSKVSPVLRSSAASGQTACKSALKLQLTGAGEQSAPAGLNKGQRRVHKGKIALLDELALGAQRQLTTEVNRSGLQAQLGRIMTSLDEQAVSLREVADRHAHAATQRSALSVTLGQFVQRLGEMDDLLGRFGLLSSQYESDLARLTMVNESGNLLGYLHSGTCVFCGAEPEHQQMGAHAELEGTALHSAITAESSKTRRLLADLGDTIEDLRLQRSEMLAERDSFAEQARNWDLEIARIEASELRPLESRAAELMEARSKVERELGLHDRIQELDDVRASLVSEGAAPSGRPAGTVASSAVVNFERVMQRTLDAWNVQRDGQITYDPYNAELMVGERSRASHGKGMRAVLHAAFTVALADLCLHEENPHPGFVVLDSPLVTFREPGTRGHELGEGVVSHFYRHLHNTFAGQTVVVENGDPPADILDQAKVYMFSREVGEHRFGFFPVGADGEAGE